MNMTTVDWSEVYRDLNQVSERIRLNQLEFSEVMVIQRMHIKLSELDLGHLDGAEKVKHLYVFADVVESDLWEGQAPPDVRLPGSMSVVIMCRVWHVSLELSVSSNGSTYTSSRNVPRKLQLTQMRLHVDARTPGSLRRVDLQTSQDVSEPCLCVYADVIRTAFRPVGGGSNWDPAILLPPSILFTIVICYETTTQGQVIGTRRSGQSVTVNQFRAWFNLHQDLEIPSVPGTPVTLNRDLLFLEMFALNIGELLQSDSHWVEPAFSVLTNRDIPVALLTDPDILPAMHTSMLIAELVEVGHPSAATIEVVHEHVKWLNKLVLQVIEEKEGKDVEEYSELLFRTQYVLKKVGRMRGLIVPQLQYSAYSNLINRMAQVAESYDQSLRQFRLFIQHNKILGSFLLEQNQAFAEKEKDMDIFYSELISQREIELGNILQKMERLGLQMDTQTTDMKKAQEDMEQGLRRFQNEQVARAMFAVLGAIAAIGLAVLTGGATAPAAMAAATRAVTLAGTVANALQRVLTILEGLQAVMEYVALIKELVDSLQDLGQMVDLPEMPELPTEADWLIFVNEVEAVAEQMPTEVSEVTAWKTKCKNVAVLGREMISSAFYISQLQYDIKMQGMLQQIARKQADRLSGIQLSDLTNYTEMVTQMDMRTTRMLVALIKVVQIQNAALMYQYLSTPTPVDAWPVSMSTVWSLLVQHEHTAVQGLMRLGPAYDIVRTYVVEGIPVSLLLDGDDWEFEIPAEHHITFPLSLSRVRIHHLEMKFVQEANVHRPITDTGSIYILLQGSRNFNDRSESEIIHYEAATSLDYHYAYRLDTGETTVSNLPSAEFVETFMRMTPFTNWRLRVSASAEENKGLAFPTATSADSTTQIAITFFISAIRQISL